MPVSAGRYVREFDFSDYTVQLGYTAVAFVGGASKGPIGVPTLCTSVADLIAKFGKPLLDDYGVQAGVQFFKEGDNLTYLRVANGAATATYPIPGLAGGTPAVKAAGTVVFTGNNNPADADYVTIAATRPIADLNADVVGAAHNVAITTSNSTAIKVAGMSGGTASVLATGSIELAALPADGNTVTIGDGTTSVVFEFDNDSTVGGSSVAVIIVAGDPYATLTNLISAINASALTLSASDNVVKKVFEFDSNATFVSGRTPVLIGATALDTMVNLISAISLSGLPVTVANTTVTVPQATITATVAGVDGNATILKSGTNITVTGLSGGTDAVAGSVMTVMTLKASSPGTWGNGLRAVITSPSVVVAAPSGNFDLSVYAPLEDGSDVQLVERFNNLSLDAADARFISTILANGKSGEVGSSTYVVAEVVSGAGTTAAGTYIIGTSPGTVGANGTAALGASDYVGSVSGQTATGLQALRNPETTEFNVIAVPGVSHASVIQAVFDLCAKRGDCFGLIDPPLGLSDEQVVDWHNGLSTIVPNAPTGYLDTSRAALFWSWEEVNDTYNSKTVWLPPSGQVAAAMAYSDRVAGPWFAFAGSKRGIISANRVEISPDFDAREMLAAEPNRVNPIVSMPEGLRVWGNRTLQRRLTALNSIHIRRMLLYVEKVCATAVKYLVFDPNDRTTWEEFTSLVSRELSNVQAKRGLESFKVICDESTNPPEQRQRKTMRGKILIKPIEAAEIIFLDFALFATGSGEFNENF